MQPALWIQRRGLDGELFASLAIIGEVGIGEVRVHATNRPMKSLPVTPKR